MRAKVINCSAYPGPHYPEIIDKIVEVIHEDILDDGEWALVVLNDDGVPYVVNNGDLDPINE